MFDSIEQIIEASKAAEDDFFNHYRMRTFWTNVHGNVIDGNMFITSERQTLSSQQLFTIRRVLSDGRIEKVGRFQQYDTYADAREAARRLGSAGSDETGVAV